MLCLPEGIITFYIWNKRCLQLFAAVFILLCSSTLSAQDFNQYHINLENGLSSNNVYNLNFDHLGYMWICTDRGIVRYNGYELKTYTLTDGLSGNDIWHSVLDLNNRLWLQTVSNKMGYMINNKYHEIYLSGINRSLYPKEIISRESGILLMHPSQTDIKRVSLYIERKDTLRESKYNFLIGVFIDSNTIVDIHPNEIKRYHFTKDDDLKYVGSVPNRIPEDSVGNKSFIIGKNIGTYSIYGNSIQIENIYTGVSKKLVFTHSHGEGNRMYVVSGKTNNNNSILFGGYIYTIDSELVIQQTRSLDSFTHNEAIDEKIISHFTETRFWNNCITTRTNGVYINYETKQQLHHTSAIDLTDYQYIGNGGDTASYWWNYTKQTIQRIDQRGKASIHKYPVLSDAIKVIPYDNTRSLLLSKNKMHWLDHKSQRINASFRFFNVYEKGHKSEWHSKYNPYSRSIAVLDDSSFYITGGGVYKCDMRNDTLNFNLINNDRFYNMEHDSVRKLLWIYNDYKIFLHSIDDTKKDVTIKDNILKSFGIGNIEKIEPDDSKEHIFLKDNSQLYYINFKSGTIRSLFRNYNLQNAFFRVQNHTIILAGKFGLLFSKIKGPGVFSDPILYPNIKNSLYHSMEDIAVLDKKVILKTDKGVYIQAIPADSVFTVSNITEPKYKMIMSYQDTLYDLQKHSKLDIFPGNTKISFDIINPEGNGTIAYRYFINGVDTTWHELNGSELKLPSLDAEKSYILSIEARDAVWRSDPISVTLYMVPTWWQTLHWRITFWISGIITLLALILVVILLTRYHTIRSGRKKQHMILLELRAIYAQINPHFIFNTLNTALYFIKKNKMTEAATHVSKFSTLLRSYIESSRYRYISVAHEIVNIRNYIELQQTRFEHAFTFDIITDEAITLQRLYIPTLLLQPIVENAINHGLVPKGSGGHLIVAFHYQASDHSIICIIEDNGIGREESKLLHSQEQTKKESYGSKLIEELIDIFNKYEQIKITINYYDKQLPETGTRVTITIKNPYDEQHLQLHHNR